MASPSPQSIEALLSRLDALSADPAGGPTRLRELAEGLEEAWARFLTVHGHLLLRGGSEALLQAALAEPEGSPVAREVEDWLATHPEASPRVRLAVRPVEAT